MNNQYEKPGQLIDQTLSLTLATAHTFPPQENRRKSQQQQHEAAENSAVERLDQFLTANLPPGRGRNRKNI